MKHTLSLMAVFATLSIATLGLTQPVHASTADGATPAEETVCDTSTGVEFGICNAYCEATDCGDGSITHTDDAGCNALEDAYYDLTSEDLECGTSVPTDSCFSKCYEQAERRYMTCFERRRVVKKDFVRVNAAGAYELNDTGRKLYGDTTKIRKCEYDRCYTDRDCATNVKTWLSSCSLRCGEGHGIIKK